MKRAQPDVARLHAAAPGAVARGVRVPAVRERTRGALAVALHGIEPACFERCALIRDWLADHGVERVTLLVVPARDLHPIGSRSPEMVEWLLERRRAGDEIAQHGFRHLGVRSRATPLRALAALPARRAEFNGLDAAETRAAVHAGWRVLKIAGLDPEGFVAPAYAYTPELRAALAGRYGWTADVLGVRDRDGERRALAPAWSIAGPGRLARLVSPLVVRGGARLPVAALRLDVHPADVAQPQLMAALESVLARVGRARFAVTYGELAGR